MEIVDSYISVRLIKLSKISIPVFYRNPKLQVTLKIDYSNRLPKPIFSGSISGKITIKEKDTAGLVVKAFEMDSDLLVSTATTDEMSNYAIDNLDPSKKYYIIVIDPENLWERRIRSNITPV